MQSIALPYNENLFPNVTPQLTPDNFAALQNLNAASSFELQFSSLTRALPLPMQ